MEKRKIMNSFLDFIDYVKENSWEEILKDSIIDYFTKRNIVFDAFKEIYYFMEKYDKFSYKETDKSSIYFKENILDIKENGDRYLHVYRDILKEEKSKKIYFNMLKAKVFVNVEFIAQAYEYLPTQYFNKDIFDFHAGEVYIDCGAYNGDTVEDFIKTCPDYDKIYAYEAIPEVASEAEKRLKEFYFDSSIVIKQNAVSNSEEILFFSGQAMQGDSKIDEAGEIKVHSVLLDKEIKEDVSFLKLDIEGSEIQALEGAKAIIQKNEPKIAVCIYHKADDFWKIPEFIYNLCDKYEFKVRQYRKYEYYDTILYCIPTKKRKDGAIPDKSIIDKRKNIILNRAVLIAEEDNKMAENINDAKIWLLNEIAKLEESKNKIETDYNNKVDQKEKIEEDYNSIIKNKEKIEIDYAELVKEKSEIQSKYLKKIEACEILEYENKQIKEKNIELDKEKEMFLVQNAEIKNQIVVLKDATINSLNEIEKLFEGTNFGKLAAMYAILGRFKRVNIKERVKILAKLGLRIFGLKKNFYIDNFRLDYKILNHVYIIKNLYFNMKDKFDVKNNQEKSAIVNTDITRKVMQNVVAKEPKITVLLPVYNHSDYIAEAIRGVQYQTYTNWELIILNDGSTDNLMDILKEYKNDNRIKIYTQENQHLPNALTNLHKLASGEYITWTSADNIMMPEMLAELLKYLIYNPKAVMAFGDVAIIDNKGNFKTSGYREINRDYEKPYVLRLPHETGMLDLENDNYINACFMYRGNAARAMGGVYDAELEGLEDYDFWLRLQAFGEIGHIKNKEPLYYYRVHTNTMSEDLIKNKLEYQVKRSKLLIEFSKKRKEFAIEKWSISVENEDNESELEKLLRGTSCLERKKAKKSFKYIECEEIKDIEDEELLVQKDEVYYNIFLKANDKIEKRGAIFKGCEISALAKKTRQIKHPGLFWEYPLWCANKKIIGAHCNLSEIDTEKTICFIKKNEDKAFVFCSLPKANDKKKIEKIMQECKNVLYIGEQEMGEAVLHYAAWNALFIPPTEVYCLTEYFQALQLAWSIGKWLLIEESIDLLETYPLMVQYNFNEKLLGLPEVNNINQIETLLDQYIIQYSPQGAAKNLILYLNGIGQDIYVKKPDFQGKYRERKSPQIVDFNENEMPFKLVNGYIGIMVDTLDKGGLEQVVAFLVREFTKRNLNIKVFCIEKAGEVAKLLRSENYEVVEFNGDREKFDSFLGKNPPILVNTHYSQKMVDVVYKHKIPIVEVIHNMYVFLDNDAWKLERKKEKYLTRMIAVSSLVKQIYIEKHGDIKENKIDVVGNVASIERTQGLERNYVREIMGIPIDAIVFINVSSFDGRKNQLGILTAFETYYQLSDIKPWLIFVGNSLSEFYRNAIDEYKNELISKDHIIILDYHKNIADILAVADVFIMDSYFEGWSIAATEALYSGIPLIHSNCGSGLELIKGGKNGILIENPIEAIEKMTSHELMANINTRTPNNTDQLIQAMTVMGNDIEMWRESRERIKAESLINFNVDIMINGYIKTFLKTIEEFRI